MEKKKQKRRHKLHVSVKKNRIRNTILCSAVDKWNTYYEHCQQMGIFACQDEISIQFVEICKYHVQENLRGNHTFYCIPGNRRACIFPEIQPIRFIVTSPG